MEPRGDPKPEGNHEDSADPHVTEEIGKEVRCCKAEGNEAADHQLSESDVEAVIICHPVVSHSCRFGDHFRHFDFEIF